jgi:uncharacterized membrane protein YdjX (TVP38/TMEM64 family)
MTLESFLLQLSKHGPVPFVLCSSWLCALPAPVVSGVICAVCGSLYGTVKGAIAFSVAATLSSAYVLVVARSTVCSAQTARLAVRWRMHRSLDTALEAQAFLLALLLRISPIMPFGIASFVLAVSPISPTPYFVGTVLGSLISALPFAWAGSAAAGTGGERVGPVHVVAAIVGAGATVKGGAVLRRILALQPAVSTPKAEGAAETP